MNKRMISFVDLMTFTPEHPEHTAYRAVQGYGLNFDYIIQIWPNRASMLKTLEMQSRRGSKFTDWRDFQTLLDRRKVKTGEQKSTCREGL